MDRFLDRDALRNLDEGAVLEERGVQRGKWVLLVLREARQVRLQRPRVLPHGLREAHDPHALREWSQVREPRRIPPVHEDEEGGLEDPERVRLAPLPGAAPRAGGGRGAGGTPPATAPRA